VSIGAIRNYEACNLGSMAVSIEVGEVSAISRPLLFAMMRAH
jgi:hypothetical protein